MLQTLLVKLSEPRTPSGATDDGSEIGHPKAEMLPPPLFSKSSTPESDDLFDDTFDAKFSTLNHQMKSTFTESGNTETKFFWMVDQMSFRQLFRLYAKYGDHTKSGETITLSCSDRWLRKAKIIDNRRISTSDTGIYFKQVAKFKKSLSVRSYETFLQLLAKKKHLNFDEVKYKMVTAGPPETMKTIDLVGTECPKYSSCRNEYATARRKKDIDNRAATQTSIPVRFYRKKEPVKRSFEDFFSNCQCQHGFSSQISYSFPDNLHATAYEERNEDWFPDD